jgi:hypothetical protein
VIVVVVVMIWREVDVQYKHRSVGGYVGKKGLLIRCRIPTRIKAKFGDTDQRQKIPSRLEMIWGVESGPRWDQRSLKCLGAN